jgi:hypothetical protein
MTIRDRKSLRQTANRRLQVASYKPNRLVLIHSGIALGAGLLVAIVQYILQQQTHQSDQGDKDSTLTKDFVNNKVKNCH